VHQGNGTAKIFEQQPCVYTFSLHGEHNYPFRKEKSDLDVPLADGTNDTAYLSQLKILLPKLINEVKPDFAFYLSGVDILDTDKYGKLNVSREGCRQRDEMVFTVLKQYQVPCGVSMGGGYSADIKIITDAHCNTFAGKRYL
ncbi:MAG: histone deacetylase, partial [Ferruginibacter sp.]